MLMREIMVGDQSFSYEIRWAKEHEWDQAMKLIWETFLEFEANDYSPKGVEDFNEFLFDGTLRKNFLKGEYQLAVAVLKDPVQTHIEATNSENAKDDKSKTSCEKIIGAASLRNTNFLSLLFVDKKYHKKGIGAALLDMLCEYLKDEAGVKFIHLASSPYAVGFYLKQGFHATDSELEIAGIRVTPMEKHFTK